jgi:hypothetical protein
VTALALAVVYALVGVGLGWRAWSRPTGSVADRASSAALATLLWPLWAPFALESPRRSSPPRGARGEGVVRAIDAARAACVEAGLDGVFSEAMAERLHADVARSVARIESLSRTLASPDFDPRTAEARQRAADDPSLEASAALHARNVRRMRALLEADERAMRELEELLRALRSQLALARFVGSSEADASGIVSEVWARVEGLGAVIEPSRDAPDDPHGHEERA